MDTDSATQTQFKLMEFFSFFPIGILKKSSTAIESCMGEDIKLNRETLVCCFGMHFQFHPDLRVCIVPVKSAEITPGKIP